MICTHLRSSAIGTLQFCEQKFLISYCLGFREKGNIKAEMGTALHKTLELLALRKFAEQNKEKTFTNEISDIPFVTKEVTVDKAFDLGWEYQRKLSPDFTEWSDDKTIKIYKEMYSKLLNFKGGKYNPLNLDIVQPEQFFEFEIKEPWAKYSYDIAGKELSGYLKLRGTVDLIIRDEDGHYSSLDYKTGKRVNWAVGEWFKPKVKEYSDLQNDKQLLLYYYALVKLLKTYDITSIIYYLQDGGPFELVFDEDSYKIAEGMIKSEFKKINEIKVPKLTKHLGNPAENHYNKRKCNWCEFNKVQPKISTEKTVCEFFRSQILELGMDKVLDKYVKVENLNFYAGGGAINRKTEEIKPKKGKKNDKRD